MLSCEFCEISMSTFFTEHLQTTASISSYEILISIGFFLHLHGESSQLQQQAFSMAWLRFIKYLVSYKTIASNLNETGTQKFHSSLKLDSNLSKNTFISFNDSPSKIVKMLFISPWKFFLFPKYLHFCLGFLIM